MVSATLGTVVSVKSSLEDAILAPQLTPASTRGNGEGAASGHEDQEDLGSTLPTCGLHHPGLVGLGMSEISPFVLCLTLQRQSFLLHPLKMAGGSTQLMDHLRGICQKTSRLEKWKPGPVHPLKITVSGGQAGRSSETEKQQGSLLARPQQQTQKNNSQKQTFLLDFSWHVYVIQKVLYIFPNIKARAYIWACAYIYSNYTHTQREECELIMCPKQIMGKKIESLKNKESSWRRSY